MEQGYSSWRVLPPFFKNARPRVSDAGIKIKYTSTASPGPSPFYKCGKNAVLSDFGYFNTAKPDAMVTLEMAVSPVVSTVKPLGNERVTS